MWLQGLQGQIEVADTQKVRIDRSLRLHSFQKD